MTSDRGGPISIQYSCNWHFNHAFYDSNAPQGHEVGRESIRLLFGSDSSFQHTSPQSRVFRDAYHSKWVRRNPVIPDLTSEQTCFVISVHCQQLWSANHHSKNNSVVNQNISTVGTGNDFCLQSINSSQTRHGSWLMINGPITRVVQQRKHLIKTYQENFASTSYNPKFISPTWHLLF